MNHYGPVIADEDYETASKKGIEVGIIISGFITK